MASTVSLPIARNDYDRDDEQTTRLAVEQELQDLREQVERVELSKTKQASLSVRRHQFLLMGA